VCVTSSTVNVIGGNFVNDQIEALEKKSWHQIDFFKNCSRTGLGTWRTIAPADVSGQLHALDAP